MISRKVAIEIARQADFLVFSELEEISYLIQTHAELGMFEFEVFIPKSKLKQFQKALDKKGYYSRPTYFETLKEECILHISWISNI